MRHPRLARGFPRLSTSAKGFLAHLAEGAAEVEPRAMEAEAEPHAAAVEVVREPHASAVGVSWMAGCDSAGK